MRSPQPPCAIRQTCNRHAGLSFFVLKNYPSDADFFYGAIVNGGFNHHSFIVHAGIMILKIELLLLVFLLT